MRDRVVLVGVSAKGTQDFVRTPEENDLPGVYVHAAAISALLGDTLVRRHGSPVDLALAAATLWLLLLLLAGPRVKGMPGVIGLGVASAAGWMATATWLYLHGYWPPVTGHWSVQPAYADARG